MTNENNPLPTHVVSFYPTVFMSFYSLRVSFQPEQIDFHHKAIIFFSLNWTISTISGVYKFRNLKFQSWTCFKETRVSMRSWKLPELVATYGEKATDYFYTSNCHRCLSFLWIHSGNCMYSAPPWGASCSCKTSAVPPSLFQVPGSKAPFVLASERKRHFGNAWKGKYCFLTDNTKQIMIHWRHRKTC